MNCECRAALCCPGYPCQTISVSITNELTSYTLIKALAITILVSPLPIYVFACSKPKFFNSLLHHVLMQSLRLHIQPHKRVVVMRIFIIAREQESLLNTMPMFLRRWCISISLMFSPSMVMVPLVTGYSLQ